MPGFVGNVSIRLQLKKNIFLSFQFYRKNELLYFKYVTELNRKKSRCLLLFLYKNK